MIKIDRNSTVPIYEQIKSGLLDLIRRSLLKTGDTVGSAQSLAETLVINPAIVRRAYAELEKEGILQTGPDGVRRIAATAPQGAARNWEDSLQSLAEAYQESRRSGISWEQITELMEMMRASESGESQSLLDRLPWKGALPKAGQSQCPYCRQQIEPGDRNVQCMICRTTHHEECWQESGHCSVFGCTGRMPWR